MDHGDLRAARGHAGGGLQPQQTAADHDRPGAGAAGRDHRVGVLQVAIGDDAGQIVPRQRDDEGCRPGGDDQRVIGHGPVRAMHDPCVAVDGGHAFAEPAGDTLRRIPGVVMGDDLVIGLVARQDRRQHQPVVVAARFRVEQGDVPLAGGHVEQMLQHPARGHARADDDQFSCHDAYSAASTKRWRSYRNRRTDSRART